MSEPAFVFAHKNRGRGVRCLFATAVLLPPFHLNQSVGYLGKVFQMNCGQLVTTSKREGFRLIYSKTMLPSKFECIRRPFRTGNGMSGSRCPAKFPQSFAFWDISHFRNPHPEVKFCVISEFAAGGRKANSPKLPGAVRAGSDEGRPARRRTAENGFWRIKL